jgi:pyrroloquinoline quinone biosynthesis protein D
MKTMAPDIDEAAIPRFGVGIKFRYDQTRGAWVILGPERLFLPDEHAVEVLKLVDGARSVGAIAADLAARYDAPLDIITADIWPMLQSLAASGAVRL